MRLPDLRFRHKMLLPPGVALLALLVTPAIGPGVSAFPARRRGVARSGAR